MNRTVAGLLSIAVTISGAAFDSASATGHTRPPATRTAVFAGGCYWGTESVFGHIQGVKSVVAGFAVPAAMADGSALPDGHKGYAEAARVVYDPAVVTYAQLLQIFFLVAHDPTEVDRQGPDVGPQYRSVIFVDGDGERQAIRGYLDELRASSAYARPIVTEIARLASFHPADDQHFVARNPDNPYVVQYDRPRLAELRRRFPSLYRE
ncbi:MAG TPA: peptide-methionine (S)-S-oxide reductase MsrA [Gemmatimonadales bacterium]|jgi:peptide-methionine (S)-S-oxide reductase